MTSSLASRRATQWVVLYGSLIVAGEVTFRFVGPGVGVLVHAALLLALAMHLTFATAPGDPLLPVLAMLPALRLAGVALPVEGIPAVVRWALLTVPMLVAIATLARTLKVSASDLGLRPPPMLRWQRVIPVIVTPLVGVPLGVLLKVAAGPTARLPVESSGLIVAAAAVTGVVILEELLFRGLLQHLFGRFGPMVAILATSTLYAVMYLNAGPLVGAAAMAVIGLSLSWLRWWTGSLYGVVGAHLVLRAIVEA